MPITPFTAIPQRSQDKNTYAANADTFCRELPTFITEANALAADVTTKEASAVSADASAVTAKNAAQAAQSASENAAGVTAHSMDTAYTVGVCVYGSDGQSYRCMIPHTGTNPVGDTSGKWVRISAGGSALTMAANFVAADGGAYIVAPGLTVDLSAIPTGGRCTLYPGGDLVASKVTLNPGSLKIMGSTTEYRDYDKNIAIELVNTGSTWGFQI